MRLNSMKYLLFIVMATFLSGCNKSTEKKKEKPLARVFNNYLYSSDLSGVIPAGISAGDSVSVAKDFIEKWVLSQLLLNKAEINLTDAEKDVELQIGNYRSSLLIYAYQQSYLRQKLDTIVSDQEIEDYFKANQPNFVLGEPLMKGVFIKVPVKAPDINKLRQWYRLNDAVSIRNLEGYCFSNAAVYDHFNEGWVNLNEVLRMIPANGESYENTLQYRKYLETKDKDYYYFLSVKEIAPEGNVSPFELVKNDIYYIILNKRKVKLINELETSIYSDAQNRENFTIYPKIK
jgi:hypothetical protein